MDYTVAIERLEAHGKDVGAVVGDASSTLSAVRLDTAAAAMPGSVSAGASRALQSRFTSASQQLVEAMTGYVDGVGRAADGYRRQEESATAALTSFFGRL